MRPPQKTKKPRKIPAERPNAVVRKFDIEEASLDDQLDEQSFDELVAAQEGGGEEE